MYDIELLISHRFDDKNHTESYSYYKEIVSVRNDKAGYNNCMYGTSLCRVSTLFFMPYFCVIVQGDRQGDKIYGIKC